MPRCGRAVISAGLELPACRPVESDPAGQVLEDDPACVGGCRRTPVDGGASRSPTAARSTSTPSDRRADVRRRSAADKHRAASFAGSSDATRSNCAPGSLTMSRASGCDRPRETQSRPRSDWPIPGPPGRDTAPCTRQPNDTAIRKVDQSQTSSCDQDDQGVGDRRSDNRPRRSSSRERSCNRSRSPGSPLQRRIDVAATRPDNFAPERDAR